MTETNKTLSIEQVKEIRENFDFFDKDSNNEIDLNEFAQLLKVISPKSTKEQAEKGFELIDNNHDGHIDFDEFMSWWETCWWEY